MFKLKGRFLGDSPRQTKSGKGYTRKFLCGDNVYTVYADDAGKLSASGDIELPVQIQDMVFAR